MYRSPGKKTYIDFAEHGERDAVVELAELLDLVVAPGVLATELVAREPNDLELVAVLALDILVQLLKARELRCEAALGGGVDDEDNLAVELRERIFSAALCAGLAELRSRKRVCGTAVLCTERVGTYCLWG